MKRLTYALFGLGLLLVGSGCVATAVGVGAGAGVGTYMYIKGELRATYNVPLEQIWPKTLAAMRDLKLTIDRKQMDALGGTIDARRADGTPVKVKLKPEGDRSTTISVRVGTFGSKEKSKRIHRAIQKQLGV
jgi:hypothetical protein